MKLIKLLFNIFQFFNILIFVYHFDKLFIFEKV